MPCSQQSLQAALCHCSILTELCWCREQVLGRNCRFLQGAQTDTAEVQRMRDAMAADPPRAVTVKLLNYKVNGQPFWNALHIAPIRSADGRVSILPVNGFMFVNLGRLEFGAGDGDREVENVLVKSSA